MNKKIFKYIVLVSIISLFTAFVLSFCVVYGFFSRNPGVMISPSGSINSVLAGLAVYTSVTTGISVVISFLLAKKTTHSITDSINSIDLENPETANVYEELSPLVNRISAQNNQLARQMQHLEEEHKNQDMMRREFTANVSHELKTPLTSISGYAELIKTGIAKPEDIQKFAGKIYDESQRLITLVGDILKISRLDEDKVELTQEKIDLYSLCQSVISHLEKAILDKNLIVQISGEHLVLNGVHQLVEEIIFNLCDNAVKYNRQNGHITITLKQCVDGIEVSVTDTGIGISKEDIPHIFERFYRADKSHSKEIGGTGLGLSIVKHSANAMGSQLSVESELGVGTTVHVLF